LDNLCLVFNSDPIKSGKEAAVMAGVAATCGLVALLVTTVASLPNTLLEDTKQAALETEPIASKGKHQSK
jgi:hypothetical protein